MPGIGFSVKKLPELSAKGSCDAHQPIEIGRVIASLLSDIVDQV